MIRSVAAERLPNFMRISRLVAAERLPNNQMKWCSCVISNKRGRVSALLGPLSKDHCHNYVDVTNSLTQHTTFGFFFIVSRNSNLRLR